GVAAVGVSGGRRAGPTYDPAVIGQPSARSSTGSATRWDPGVIVTRLPELDRLAPVEAAERLRGLSGLALLESARPGRHARWSFLTADPLAVVDAPAEGPDPFASARRALARLVPAHLEPSQVADALLSEGDDGGGRSALPPFSGGLVGYLSYDLGRRFEAIPSIAAADQDLPLLRLALHDWVAAWDHRTGRAWLAGRAADERIDRLEARLAEVRSRLARAGASSPISSTMDGPGDARPEDSRPLAGERAAARSFELRSGLARPAFEARVEAVRQAIARGEIYQANLTRRLEVAFGADPWRLYRRLRVGDPALFAAYLDLGRSPATGAPRAIVSASPEPFLALTSDGHVETNPIKGTRPRGVDRAEERTLARELLASAKDRAENVMIVDVLRNDLGRVCLPGSVRVPRLCRLERTATVQHLVSTVTGRLRPGVDAFGLLAATFPGGSITGAPKIRAMQIIEGLEPVRRGPYTGAAGWIGADGALATSILIRTFVADGDRLSLHVGGGITWRSDPASEWLETVAKASGPLGAIDGHEVA
ncbi:MAG TPA: anthranilate synthase component I family protein, partial [Candidatus Binatus sp.]|nr:anthranilate synthase component I family protein [Candidatus Binatus sp.]